MRNFSKVVESGDFSDLSLTIYFTNPNVLYGLPTTITVRDLMNGESITVDGNTLKEHIDLLKQLNSGALVPIGRRPHYTHARIHYVFKTKNHRKLLEVTMWGCGDFDYEYNADEGLFYHNGIPIDQENDIYKRSILIYGYEVKENAAFYDIIIPFLSEDQVRQLEYARGRQAIYYDWIAASSKEILQTTIDQLATGNSDLRDQYMESGDYYILPQGTKIEIMQEGSIYSKYLVLDGIHVGKEFWTFNLCFEYGTDIPFELIATE